MDERSGSGGATAGEGTPPALAPLPPRAAADPSDPAQAGGRHRHTPEAPPLSHPGLGGTQDPRSRRSSSQAPRPQDPHPGWDWRHAAAGALVAFSPTLLLYLLARQNGGGASVGEVNVVSAFALALGSLIAYGWQTVVAWAFSLRLAGNRLEAWGFRRVPLSALWMIPLSLACVYAVALVHDLLFHPPPQDIVEAFPHNAAGIALFVLVAVVMAPLFEEVFFRGFIFGGFAASWGWLWGAVASSVVFALAHAQLSVFVPIFGLGFALAWLYRRTGSLWSCVALHALFNAISVAAWALT